MKTIDIRDALDLENYEKIVFTNRRTRRAIHDTYGEKQPTKFRRKLGGKRRWKNKQKQYAKLEGQMTVAEFNAKQKANKAIERVFRAKQGKRHMLYGDE